jgi:hypothetical protein
MPWGLQRVGHDLVAVCGEIQNNGKVRRSAALGQHDLPKTERRMEDQVSVLPGGLAPAASAAELGPPRSRAGMAGGAHS